MLQSHIANDVIDHALASGAEFAELFIEHNILAHVSTLNDQVEAVRSGIDFGIGVRLLFGFEVFYGYTNSKQKKDLIDLFNQLTAIKILTKTNNIRPLIVVSPSTQSLHRLASKPLSQGAYNSEKVLFLQQANQVAKQASQLIKTTKGFVLQREQSVEIYNSEGLHASDTRHYARAGLTAIAVDKTQATGSWNTGGLVGWELQDDLQADVMGGEASRQALVNIRAKPCPSGTMPVVIGSRFGGVIFHEACGHLLETTAVAKQASVFHDKMGQAIASSCVNAVDEGLTANAWGSITIDDEGMATQRTQLIKDGILNQFLVDKVGALQTGYQRTGSGRRESYRYAPASRMRNTYIEAGSDTVEDMIASIDRGLYARHMGGGSVQPGTGEFNFAVTEGYYVEKGKIQYPVKAATLISTGPKVLKSISMVGTDFNLACGMCGSVSGAVPTTVGQPTLKVDAILVGGNAK